MRVPSLALAVMSWGLVEPSAAPPASFTYQGSLWENGVSVTSTKTMSFRLTDSAGVPTYWDSGPQSVYVNRSHFAVRLSPTGVDWSTATPSLEVTVDGVTLSPREPLDAVPYSFVASSVEGGVRLAPLAAPPSAARGRLYFDSGGEGAVRVSLDGATFVSLATGTAGAGGASATAADPLQFAGNGSSGAPLVLKASSVTLQGNAFNGAGQLLRLDTVGRLPILDGSQLTGIFDGTKVLKSGDAMTGDLQVGGLAASTVSAAGFVTMAQLTAPPPAARGRLYFDSAGGGALKVSLNGASFVGLATGTAGSGLSSVEGDAGQMTGDGSGGNPLRLRASSVTLQGNSFNGANQLLRLHASGGIPAVDGSLLTGVSAARVPASGVENGVLGVGVIASSIAVGAVQDAAVASLSASKLTGALPPLDGSALVGLTDGGAVRRSGDQMSGDLQVGGSAASTVSAMGFVTMANLAAPPPPARGRLFFDPNGDGAIRVSLNGASFVRLATGTAGAGLSGVEAVAGQMTGDGTSGSPLALVASSVTLQGNAFNGAGQLLRLDAAGRLPSLDGSQLFGVSDAARVLKTGDTLTGDLQVGGAAASTVSAAGFVTMANLAAPPAAARGRLFFDTSGGGALKVSLDGSSFVGLATATSGAGLSSVAVDAAVYSGDGTAGNPLSLRSSSVTLRGNAFNGPDRLLLLDGTGGIPATVIASSVAAGAVDTAQLRDGSVTNAKIGGMSAAKLTGALPALDGSALTGITATQVTASGVQPGALGASVIASSVAVAAVDTIQLKDAAVTNAKITGVSSSKLSGALPALDGSALTGVSAFQIAASGVQAGALGSSVIASSVAAGAVGMVQLMNAAVTDAKIAGMSASKLSGALPALDGSALMGIAATCVNEPGVINVACPPYNAVPNDGTDDWAAFNLALTNVSPGGRISVPPGTYSLSQTLTTNKSNFALHGAGPYQTVLQGTFAGGDILMVGSEAGESKNVDLRNFRVTSTVLKTSGAAIHLRRVSRSSLSSVIIDGQDGTGNLWNGIWFDAVDFVSYSDFVAGARHNAVIVNGYPGGGPKADLIIVSGKILFSDIGILVGGAFGGLVVDQVDAIANRVNVQIDQSLVAEANRELFFGPGCMIDSAGDEGILVNEPGAAYITLSGTWLASSRLAGLHVQSLGGQLQYTGGTVFNNGTDGVKIDAPNPTVMLNAMLIRNNGGYAVNNIGNAALTLSGLREYSNASGFIAGGVGATGAETGKLTLASVDTGQEGGRLEFKGAGAYSGTTGLVSRYRNFLRVLGGVSTVALFDFANARTSLGTAAAPLSTLDVGGGVAVGGYAGANAAPANGLVVSGSVGIGTPSPDQALSVNGIIRGQSVTNSGPVLLVGNDTGLVDIDVANTMAIWGQSNNAIASVQLGSGGGTLSGSGGNIGIGTASPGYRLDVQGGDINTSAGFRAGGVCLAGTCSSDLRLKKDIAPLPRILDKLVRLKPVSFNWRTDEFPAMHLGPSPASGLIAQDVERVFPEMVTPGEGGYKAVEYHRLPLLMLEAIRELEGKVRALEKGAK